MLRGSGRRFGGVREQWSVVVADGAVEDEVVEVVVLGVRQPCAHPLSRVVSTRMRHN